FAVGINRAQAGALQSNRSLSIELTDERSVITRRISRSLLLRLVKERTVDREHFGWNVEVVRVPYRPESDNLVCANASGKGPDPSMIYAWHVADRYYPNERELPVRGYAYVVKVALMNPRVLGNGPKAGFISGTLGVSWARQSAPASAAPLEFLLQEWINDGNFIGAGNERDPIVGSRK